ncbi:M50 family metallopeptidase [uncultured Nocardioides sp.]|uniref:M50 family metallopeptidase n=1 Tax=uncultured Nocardioides sp. TaxID=198441 RepID=UPI0026237872|nr:M50 family metallopeptidase [uncultured Nocardioides sp.]
MNSLSEIWDSEIWDRATATQPVPGVEVVLGTGLIALVLVLAPVTWPRVRLGVTVVHEAGHALVGVLVGRRLKSVHLHSDTSGLTITSGKPRGPGMVAMLAAGYLAPAALGLVAALLLAAGRSVGLLWLLVVLTALLLLWVRNGYGFLVLLAGGAGVLLLTWYGDGTVQSVAAYLITWLLLLAAPRPLVELLTAGRRRGRTSDPDQLARLTRIPAVLWILALLLANLTGLVVGVTTLAPDVA